jgi:hypothetical protein
MYAIQAFIKAENTKAWFCISLKSNVDAFDFDWHIPVPWETLNESMFSYNNNNE